MGLCHFRRKNCICASTPTFKWRFQAEQSAHIAGEHIAANSLTSPDSCSHVFANAPAAVCCCIEQLSVPKFPHMLMDDMRLQSQ
jgi:hypothetical protein